MTEKDAIFIILRIVLCVGAIFVQFVADTKSKILEFSIKIGVSIAFIASLILTNWSLTAIPKIILFVSGIVCINAIAYSDKYKIMDKVCWISVTCAVLATILFVVMLAVNRKDVEEPEVVVTTQEIIMANDGTTVNGNISGGGFIVWSVHGSIDTDVVYRYYYKLDNGGIKLGQVEADKTTIFYLTDGETPYIEKVKYKYYLLDYNKTPPEKEYSEIMVKYNIYVPEGSIGNVYEFDAK